MDILTDQGITELLEQLQKATDGHTDTVDEVGTAKETEIMQV